MPEIADILSHMDKTLSQWELQNLLNGEYDQSDAILTINAGAGGTDAQDWAEMVLRMEMRWAERRGFKVELLEASAGEEAGIKSATFRASGDNAYGLYSAEKGVHRLVRLSPFDSANRRQTSFAGVEVAPVVEEAGEVAIEDDDLQVDTYRASGAGGQHVNKTDSAIRITHLPTGIVVECQDERSQHKNRARALSLLQARLRNAEEQKRQTETAEKRRSLVGTGDRSERIRTYNFPQGRLTDHRINLTLYKLDDVVEGDLDDVIGPLANEYRADQLGALGLEP